MNQENFTDDELYFLWILKNDTILNKLDSDGNLRKGLEESSLLSEQVVDLKMLSSFTALAMDTLATLILRQLALGNIEIADASFHKSYLDAYERLRKKQKQRGDDERIPHFHKHGEESLLMQKLMYTHPHRELSPREHKTLTKKGVLNMKIDAEKWQQLIEMTNGHALPLLTFKLVPKQSALKRTIKTFSSVYKNDELANYEQYRYQIQKERIITQIRNVLNEGKSHNAIRVIQTDVWKGRKEVMWNQFLPVFVVMENDGEIQINEILINNPDANDYRCDYIKQRTLRPINIFISLLDKFPLNLTSQQQPNLQQKSDVADSYIHVNKVESAIVEKIETIECVKNSSKLQYHGTIIINKKYNKPLTVRLNKICWKTLFEIAEKKEIPVSNQSRGSRDFLNGSENTLVKKHGYIKTKLIAQGENVLIPAIKIYMITKKQYNIRKKSKQN